MLSAVMLPVHLAAAIAVLRTISLLATVAVAAAREVLTFDVATAPVLQPAAIACDIIIRSVRPGRHCHSCEQEGGDEARYSDHQYLACLHLDSSRLVRA